MELRKSRGGRPGRLSAVNPYERQRPFLGRGSHRSWEWERNVAMGGMGRIGVTGRDCCRDQEKVTHGGRSQWKGLDSGIAEVCFVRRKLCMENGEARAQHPSIYTARCGCHRLLSYKGSLEVALAFAHNIEGLPVILRWEKPWWLHTFIV